MQTKHARNLLDFMLFVFVLVSTGEHPPLERITLHYAGPGPGPGPRCSAQFATANKQVNKRGKRAQLLPLLFISQVNW